MEIPLHVLQRNWNVNIRKFRQFLSNLVNMYLPGDFIQACRSNKEGFKDHTTVYEG